MSKTKGALLITGILTVLIFFSKTIYTINRPQIIGVKPFRGTLNKLELSRGISDWAVSDNTYSPVEGTVSEVLVKEGDSVLEGQDIIVMDFKSEEAERRLAEIQNNIVKINNDLKNLNKKLEQLKTALEKEESENSALVFDIIKAQADLKYAQMAYGYGSISRRDVENAQYNLQALYLKAQTECETLSLEIEAKSIDLKNMRLQEEAAFELLRDYSTYTHIKAPCDGIVSSITVEKGRLVRENDLLFSIGRGQFNVECAVAIENNFVIQGDKCYLSNSSHVVEGLVTKVKPFEGGKTVTIHLLSNEIESGESFEVRFEKTSTTSYTLVPNAAVNQDNDGYFLNQIKRRKGIVGEEYYIQRLDVYIGDSDLDNTAIIKGLTFFEPVVLVSSKPFYEDDAVLLKNADEFFEQ